MFGNLGNLFGGKKPAPRGLGPLEKYAAEFPFPDAPAHPGGAVIRTMATYDRFGETMVATITLDALFGRDADGLNEQLVARLEAEDGVKHLVLDLQNVQSMDSMCIGLLVELLTRIQAGGGRIALVNTSGNVEYLFKITQLDRIFPVCRDVPSAIKAVERRAA